MKERRDDAYAVMAGAMLGREYPGSAVFEGASVIVLSDERKSRTPAERSVQLWTRTDLLAKRLTDAAFDECLTQYSDAISGSLSAATGEST